MKRKIISPQRDGVYPITGRDLFSPVETSTTAWESREGNFDTVLPINASDVPES
jgi:hypothetical protein